MSVLVRIFWLAVIVYGVVNIVRGTWMLVKWHRSARPERVSTTASTTPPKAPRDKRRSEHE